MRNWSIFRHLRTRRVAAILLAAAMMYGTLPVAYAQESTLTQQEIIAQVTSGSGVTSENDVESAEAASSSEAASESVAESAEAASSSEAASESMAESTETASSSEATPESVAGSAETASSSEAAPESVVESSETASSSAITNEIKEESVSQAENAAQTLKGEEMQEGNFVFYIDSNEEAQIVRYTGSISTGGKIVIPHLLGGKPVTGGDLQIPENVTDLTVEFAQGTTTIFDICRGGKWLKKVILPSSVQVISGPAATNMGAFSGCTNLAEIEWGGIKSEPGQLIIPEGVTEIGDGAFHGCEKITYVKFPSTLANEPIQGSFGNIPDLTAEFAEGTTIIGDWLKDAQGLKKVILPNSVQVISGFSSNGGAFSGCTNLVEIEWGGVKSEPGQLIIPEGVTEIGDAAFKGCEKITYVKFPSTLANNPTWGSFASIPDLTAEFAEGTTTIYRHLNGAEGLKKVILPNSVQVISGFSSNGGAFSGCTNLVEIEWGGVKSEPGQLIIPEGVTEIGDAAFKGCEKITYVKFPSTLANSPTWGSFASIPNLTAEFAEGTTIIGDWLKDAQGLKKVILPASLEIIGEDAFSGCTALTQVKGNSQETAAGQARMPLSLLEICANAFKGCQGLTEFYCNGLLNNIEKNAFQNCDNLNKIVINGSTAVEDEAFENPNTVFYSVNDSKAKVYAAKFSLGFQLLETELEQIILPQNAETLVMIENTGKYTRDLMETIQLKGDAAFTKPLKFTSDNTNAITVDEEGVMYVENRSGKATVTVSCGNTASKCAFTISPLKEAGLNVDGLLMMPGETFQMELWSNPENAIPEREVEWSGERVDANGLVTAGDQEGLSKEKAVYSTITKAFDVVVVKDKNVVDSVAKLESTHRYNGSGVWTYTLEGAEQIQLDFDLMSNMGSGNDRLYLYDAQGHQVGVYSEKQLSDRSVVIPGDTVTIYLYDEFVEGEQNGWGFKVNAVREAPKEITSDEYPIDENKNISGIQPGASLESIQKDLVGQNIKVFDAKGKPVAASAPLGTGYVLTMGSFGDENQLTVVVSGDIDGDAKVAVADTIYMKQAMLGNRILEGAYQKAATFKSGSEEGPSVLDFTTMKQFMLGKISELK